MLLVLYVCKYVCMYVCMHDGFVGYEVRLCV